MLQELLELLWQQPKLNTAALLEHWRGRDEGRHIVKLAQWRPLVENLDLTAEFRGHIERIQQLLAETRISMLLDIERERLLNNDEKQELKILLQTRMSRND